MYVDTPSVLGLETKVRITEYCNKIHGLIHLQPRAIQLLLPYWNILHPYKLLKLNGWTNQNTFTLCPLD